MSFSIVYLVNRLFYRVYFFFEHWYWGGLRFFVRTTVNALESLDRYFALRVTFRYWLRPLYQDYSAIGYVLGFIFRTGRLFAGSLVYLIVISIGIAAYLFWSAFPAYIIIKGFFNF